MKTYGLIGENLSHSFSQQYFQKKFSKERIKDCQYLNFEINDISCLRELIQKKNIKGLNITIPFKEKVIPILDELTEDAKEIGAVNTIQINGNKLIGHNTDIFGFEESITPLLNGRNNAIILGNGGASKAIAFVFYKRDINFSIFSRNLMLKFADITEEVIQKNDIIINTTPLGMYPNADTFADLPYNAINTKHLLYDLVYNPEESQFLKKGMAKGAQIKNGKQMLYLQAEKSWKIWNLSINL
jgi:shikimate dehydrogenase